MRQVNEHANPEITPVLFCVDCDAPDWLADLPRIVAMPMTAAQNYGTSESTSIEHGSFLALLPGDDDDVFMKADGDMQMQRPFNDSEMEWFDGLWPDEFCAVWNAGPGDTLGDEARRVRPRVDAAELYRRFPGYESAPCGNGGVLVGRRSAYQAMHDAYMERWQVACDSFAHYARQQWLINYARFAAGLRFVLMPTAIHAQGHYGTPDGVSIENGVVMYNGAPVVFRHKL